MKFNVFSNQGSTYWPHTTSRKTGKQKSVESSSFLLAMTDLQKDANSPCERLQKVAIYHRKRLQKVAKTHSKSLQKLQLQHPKTWQIKSGIKQ